MSVITCLHLITLKSCDKDCSEADTFGNRSKESGKMIGKSYREGRKSNEVCFMELVTSVDDYSWSLLVSNWGSSTSVFTWELSVTAVAETTGSPMIEQCSTESLGCITYDSKVLNLSWFSISNVIWK